MVLCNSFYSSYITFDGKKFKGVVNNNESTLSADFLIEVENVVSCSRHHAKNATSSCGCVKE